MTDNHQMAVMRAVLTKWGAICELSRNWNGYPTSDTTYRATFGHGGGGKRLPVPNIPSFAIMTSAEVMKLQDDECNAVTIWYAHNLNSEGHWISQENRASLLGIGIKALKYRERCGRQALIDKAPKIIDAWQEWQDAQALARLGLCA